MPRYSDAVQERLLNMRYAYNKLVAYGGLECQVMETAVKYMIEHYDNPVCDMHYVLAVRNKLTELKTVQSQEEYANWFNSYVMVLPTDPFMALSYDIVVVHLFTDDSANIKNSKKKMTQH